MPLHRASLLAEEESLELLAQLLLHVLLQELTQGCQALEALCLPRHGEELREAGSKLGLTGHRLHHLAYAKKATDFHRSLHPPPHSPHPLLPCVFNLRSQSTLPPPPASAHSLLRGVFNPRFQSTLNPSPSTLLQHPLLIHPPLRVQSAISILLLIHHPLRILFSTSFSICDFNSSPP